MRVPLLDLQAQTAALREAIDAAIARVVTSAHFILGPEVEGLEAELAALSGTRFAVGMSSGTDALVASLMALGVGPGDEVVTTPYSFFATVGSIARLGARPVLCDVEPGTLNLDCARAAALCTPRTRAFMPVHLYGRKARHELLRAACPAVPIIEDAAQSVGAERHGVRAGAFGLAGCLSFFPSKNLGAFGDGGMVLTSDEPFATRLRSLRAHGSTPGRKYHHEVVGGNFRLDALQAAILRAKLPHLESFSAARARNAARYRTLLAGVPLELPPAEEPDERCVYNQFVIRSEKRDALQAWLKEHGVGSEVYYPMPLHLQPCFAGLGYGPGAFPEAEAAARDSLALPIYPELEPAQLEYVAQTVREFVDQ
jgi:dTDP-4-amino-4,6-dideoxygalactose transaminase